jgi:hypothetical protein
MSPSKRLRISISEGWYQWLEELAARARLPVTVEAACLVKMGIGEARARWRAFDALAAWPYVKLDQKATEPTTGGDPQGAAPSDR